MSEFNLNSNDAIYVTSWKEYNEGGRAGGWVNLYEATLMDEDELKDLWVSLGLNPEDELVVHDYDDLSDLGLYELFGESNPMTVIDLYRKLVNIDGYDELGVFIGLAKTSGMSEAVRILDEGALGHFDIFSYESLYELMVDSVDEKIPSTMQGYFDYDRYFEDYWAYDDEFSYNGEDYYLTEA